jgi:cytochrome c oxidase subunit II
MTDSFRKRAHGTVAIFSNSTSIYPIRRRRVRAKLALASLLPLLMSACRHAPEDDAPPDVIRQVVMKKWSIVPGRIEVQQGQEVELVVTSADVEHGIAIPKLDIREPVQPGRPTVVRFRAANVGTYPMRCSVLCGRGHDQMTGVIVVAAPTPMASHERP